MIIGLIADSHDHMEHIARAVARFKEHPVELVIHAGDCVNPGSIMLFDGVKLVGVFGNNDGDKLRLIRAYDAIGGEIKGEFGRLELDGLRVGVYHGTESAIKNALVGSGDYDVVVCGHTHRVEHRQVGGCWVFNPGTAHGFGQPGTIMIVDLARLDSPQVITL